MQQSWRYDKKHFDSRNRRRIRQHHTLFNHLSFHSLMHLQWVSYFFSQHHRLLHHWFTDTSIVKHFIPPYGGRFLRRFHHILHIFCPSFPDVTKRSTPHISDIHFSIRLDFNSICLLRHLFIRKIYQINIFYSFYKLVFMSWFDSLCSGYLNTANTVLLYAIIISIGVFLGKFKIRGISLGITWSYSSASSPVTSDFKSSLTHCFS